MGEVYHARDTALGRGADRAFLAVAHERTGTPSMTAVRNRRAALDT